MKRSIILTGPTAVGKSSLAIELAEALGLEIINADTVCFYREFNIGSAKPAPEELARIPHHLINVADPDQVYHAGEFLKQVSLHLGEIHARGKRAIIVGGSGFYLKALRLGLWDAPETSADFRKKTELESTESLFERLQKEDPEYARKIGGSDRYRIIRALEILEMSGKKASELEAAMSKEPNPDFELWIVDREKSELEERIRTRIKHMLEQGLIEEVKSLRERYPTSKTLRAVGYQEVLNHLDGITPAGRKLKPGLEGLIDEIELSHRQLAKSQRTWFKNLKPEHSFMLDRDLNLLKEKVMKFYQ